MTYIPYGSDAEELKPPELVFRQTTNQAGFDLQPSALVWVDDPFNDANLGRFTHLSSSTPGTLTITGGQASIAQPGGFNGDDYVYEGTPINMPQACVSLDVISHSGTVAAGWDRVSLCLVKDTTHTVLGHYDRIGHFLRLQVVNGSSSEFSEVGITLTPPFSLMLTMVSNSTVLWYKPDGGTWTAGPSASIVAYIDLRATDLTLWYGGWGQFSNAGGSSTWTVDNLKIGRFGHLGFRDPTVITLEDGTPVITNDMVTLTATCTDSRAAAYMGVFTLDLVTRVLTQTGMIMVDRGSKRMNDNAGHIILADGGGYHFLITTWGDAGGAPALIQVLYKNETVLALLSGANLVSGMTHLPLAGIPPSGGAYDPYMVKVGSTWYLAYTAGPTTPSTFYPVLNSSTNLTDWTLVGSDVAAFPYEGTRILKTAGDYWIAAGSLTDSRFYDLTMVYQGKQTFLSLGSGNPPHPMFVPDSKYVYCVTFDNVTNGWASMTLGNLRVFRARRYTPLFPTPHDPSDGISAAVKVCPLGYWNTSYSDSLVLDTGEVVEWYDRMGILSHFKLDQLGTVNRLLYDATGWSGQPQLSSTLSADGRVIKSGDLANLFATESWAMLLAMYVPAQTAEEHVLFSDSGHNMFGSIDHPTPAPAPSYVTAWRRDAETLYSSVTRTLGRVIYLWRYDAATGDFTWDELSSVGWTTLLSGGFTPSNLPVGTHVQFNAQGGTFTPTDAYRIITLWGTTIPTISQLRSGGEWIVNELGCPVT
jgi:hypothetical protein